jgi:hypothetical protein
MESSVHDDAEMIRAFKKIVEVWIILALDLVKIY